MEESAHRNLEVHLTGRLSQSDFQDFVPAAARKISEWGKFGIVVVMRNFDGCEPGAVWEDIKWDLKHYHDVERIALVGEKRWQAGMSKFCKPFMAAEIKYFDMNDLDRARQWVDEPLAVLA
ncbi:MAG TPA: STAS/SEC14 domain-containing protein [Verrucomicrobiae bacterium]|nr:STAS/SEC14 domain-containing protein [Verrucomicrobiae bacterium]